MRKLQEVMASPSAWDSMANYAGDVPAPEWLCVLTRTRDSDCLAESNWYCALLELGGESESVQIFRFGHWACGWWEALAVQEGTPAAAIGADIADRLYAYPVLDESDFCEREQEEADSVWRDCYRPKDRIEYIREHSAQFEFHSFADLLGCVRGNYFAGYASELLY